MVKKRILFINSVLGFGSTGRIVEDLSLIDEYESLVCYGRKNYRGRTNSYKFSSFIDNIFGALNVILLNNNLHICKKSTRKLIKKIEEYNPDLIHIHNLHGYYIDVQSLFQYLEKCNKPIIWTFHDCWPFTGYCMYFDYAKCNKYMTGCKNCRHKFSYPFSLFKQNIEYDFKIKKELFNSLNNLVIVTPSKWMCERVKESFLKDNRIEIINNGINQKEYKGKKKNKFSVLAVANYWTEEKGINELIEVVKLLDSSIEITVIGKLKTKKGLERCNLIERTNDRDKLLSLYGENHLLINTTLEDNFPTVNIESLSCGTPVITYNTGGSPEIINNKTGIIVEKGNYQEMARIVNRLKDNYYFKANDCIDRSKLYTLDSMYDKYKKLYSDLLKQIV